MTEHQKNLKEWESAWDNYITKLARLEELKALGRYGYQLRMPKKSLQIAVNELKRLDLDFCFRLGII